MTERKQTDHLDPDHRLRRTFEEACRARENAYAPYSGFKVGAAAALVGQSVPMGGCNVENVSYGGTICAERNLVVAVQAALGKVEMEHLVVVTEADPPAMPCAICLQVLQEFCPPELPIHLADPRGIRRSVTLGELLPNPFHSFERVTEPVKR